MIRFRFKLTSVFIILIGLSVLGSGLFAAKHLRESHMDGLRDHMYREIRIIMATVPWKQELSVEGKRDYFSAQAQYLKEHSELRVTFMDVDGAVLGDSDHEAALMDNHLLREELVEAREQGDVGYSERYSNTVQMNMLNAVSPVYKNGVKVGYLRLGKGLEEIEASIFNLWKVYLFVLSIVFIVAALLSYRIAKGMIRPLDNIMKVAQQITNKNYHSRVEVQSKDEIGKLGKAINSMADSLLQQMNRIQVNEKHLTSVLGNMSSGVVMIDREQNIVLLNRAAERILGYSSKEMLGKRYNHKKHSTELLNQIEACVEQKQSLRSEIVLHFPEERILEMNLVPLMTRDEWSGIVMVMHDISEIRRLERMRSEFVANVSHELKTPIASVKGFTETLLSGAMDDKETATSFLQIIYDESERLNRLIMDILELSKIESKQVPLEYSPIELQSFVQNTMERMMSEASKKDIELICLVDEGIFVEADEDRLRQVLINLISNGINYTLEGGTVKVQAEPVGASIEDYEKVRFIISDTGIGIPKKDLPRVFERFYRVDKARSRISGGTGLGLSIVKHIVELHKGHISVQSEVGMGTEFIIELPVLATNLH